MLALFITTEYPIVSHFDEQCREKKGEVATKIKQIDENKKMTAKIKSGRQNK